LSNTADQFAEHHTEDWLRQINPIEAIYNDASNQFTLFGDMLWPRVTSKQQEKEIGQKVYS